RQVARERGRASRLEARLALEDAVEAVAGHEVEDHAESAVLRLAAGVDLDDRGVAVAAREELGLATEALAGARVVDAEEDLRRGVRARLRARDLEDGAHAAGADLPHDPPLA